jgi:hypothetical protein
MEKKNRNHPRICSRTQQNQEKPVSQWLGMYKIQDTLFVGFFTFIPFDFYPLLSSHYIILRPTINYYWFARFEISPSFARFEVFTVVWDVMLCLWTSGFRILKKIVMFSSSGSSSIRRMICNPQTLTYVSSSEMATEWSSETLVLYLCTRGIVDCSGRRISGPQRELPGLHSKTNVMQFSFSLLRIKASTYFDYYFLILTRRCTSSTWYIACALCQLGDRHAPRH